MVQYVLQLCIFSVVHHCTVGLVVIEVSQGEGPMGRREGRDTAAAVWNPSTLYHWLTADYVDQGSSLLCKHWCKLIHS